LAETVSAELSYAGRRFFGFTHVFTHAVFCGRGRKSCCRPDPVAGVDMPNADHIHE
jgi:hypothetical protein